MFSEAATTKDVRKGVAFKSRTLDDQETGVFAQRLAKRLWQKPDESKNGKRAKKQSPSSTRAYGDFLRQSVHQQGDVLADMNWAQWQAVTKAAMELGGNPNNLSKSPAERHALVSKIDWRNVTLPALKAKLGPSFRVPDGWKREFGLARLKRIKAAVERGQALTNPHDQKLLYIWRTLETQLGADEGKPNQILPSGPQADVGPTKLPMNPTDRRRFYSALTGTNEGAEPAQTPLQLSPQSAYDYLTQRYGVEVISDEEAKDLYLNRILQDLRNNNAFIPSSAQGSEADRKRWKDSASRSWGGFLPPARSYDPSNAPGVAQRLAGMTTRGFRTRTNPSGRQVPYKYGEPQEFQWPASADDMPGLKYSIDVPSQEIPNENINAFYKSKTPEAAEAVRQELEKPARDAVTWLQRKGWIDDTTKMDDFAQDVVMGMMARTAAVPNWRDNVGFRRTTAMMLAKRYASQGWSSQTRERTGHTGREDDQPGTLDMATGSNRSRGEDEFSTMRGGAAQARQVIQRAIATMLDTDTEAMGGDEDDFVSALDALDDPSKAIDALDTLDQLSTRYERELPQVKRAVDRIHRHLEPLMSKVG